MYAIFTRNYVRLFSMPVLFLLAEINIELSPLDHEKFRFKLSDNGVGLPNDFNPKSTSSLGTKLVLM